MAALDRLPCIELRGAELGFLAGMPADGRGIKQNIRAGKRRQTRGFRIPLIPTHQDADASERVSKLRKPRSPGVK